MEYKRECCYIDCSSPADYEIRPIPNCGEEDYTDACFKHLEQLICYNPDAPGNLVPDHFEIYLIAQPVSD